MAAWLVGLAAFPVSILVDAPLSSLARGTAWPVMTRFLAAVTWLGYGLVDIAVFLGLAALAWWRADKARTMPAIYGAVLVAASGLLNQVVKNLACRARPGAVGAGGFLAQFPCLAQGYALASFPSGHATTAFCAAVILALWYPRVAPAVLPVAALVALSRVFLGAHFPSDVLAGALLGSGMALAAYWLCAPLRKMPAREGGER